MKNTLILVAVAIFAAGALYGAALYRHNNNVRGVACTAEALACPDGSYVGRGGPSCSFAACPGQGSFVGVLQKQGEGYRLFMAAPEGSSPIEVSYSLPLIVSNSVGVESLVGKKVSVQGSFTEGNTVRVSSATEITGAEGDLTNGTVGVGESVFINGVKITLNSVTQDSRCATDVQCIWAGSATANVTLQSDTDKEIRDMVLGASSVGFDAYRIALEKVSPEPVSTKEISPGEYRLTFSVVSNK